MSPQTVRANAAAFLGHKLASEKTIRNLARKTVVKKEATVANISAEVSDPVIVHESQVFQSCTWTFSVACESFFGFILERIVSLHVCGSQSCF